MASSYTEGYVYKDHGQWRAAVNIQEDGRQRRLTHKTGIKCNSKDNRGKGLAETALREWRDELVAKDEAVRPGAETTLAVYAERYIEDKEETKGARAVTTDGYRSYLGHVIGTRLGETAISKIDRDVIIEWERGLYADGLSTTTVSHIFVFLKQVLEDAYQAKIIKSNPFESVDAPRRERKPINSLDANEVHKLNEALANYGAEAFPVAVRIALMTGMRQAEICALRWRDVDLEARIIHVSHSLSKTGGRYQLDSPKTESSDRDIPYGSALERALNERRELMASELETFGAGWRDDLYVVGSPIKGTWMSPQYLGHQWHQFARIAGLMGSQGEVPRFHDLRHTFATLAIAGGVDVKTVSAILGHSNASMTLNIYADALASSKRAGMEAMDAVLSA